ncbi:hypothetical protein SODALDRAFT_106200 [Sodiomyces alkalinus F11]|uniref:Uncharacterized protein n=1 Tax=Sodiomyces alkalinus (strain CBS 110278 / VKM F-3762 / F11) TaxID=1314773 RepID=A0A3N2Q274_SODAK|nr:hypothetical protein SODALDRAFT_106200 [Sodiomyces alkalinus F11]ROT40859.1 hypothetical protein SODALDRAFT_106200 [Sodiomyces alkalinus F11]
MPILRISGHSCACHAHPPLPRASYLSRVIGACLWFCFALPDAVCRASSPQRPHVRRLSATRIRYLRYRLPANGIRGNDFRCSDIGVGNESGDVGYVGMS